MNEGQILLVEDNADDESLILMSLQKNNVGNQVTVARDGQQALDYLFATGASAGAGRRELPAVVLLDLKLPKVDGFEVLQRIRSDSRTKFLPVVILTSSDEQRDRLDSYNLGANSYVRKPVDFAEFTMAVRQLGLYWLILNRRPQDR